MQQRRYRSVVGVDVPRPRVLSTWALLGIVTLVVAALVAVFPERTLLDELQSPGEPDPLAIEYLENLVKADRDAHSLRLLLAQRQLEIGEFEAAEATLAPLLSSTTPAIRSRALLLAYRATQQATYAQAEGAIAREVGKARLRELLRRLAQERWDVADATFLVREAGALGETEVARVLLPRAADGTQRVPTETLEDAARRALAASDYRTAAELLFAAQRGARDRAEKRALFFAAVRALQSGNLLAAALAAADKNVGELADDDETLVFLTRLARAANDRQRAERYVRRMMRMGSALSTRPLLAVFLDFVVPPARAQAGVHLRPYDETVYTLAYDVFVGNGNLADAYRVAEAAVRQRPDDARWRERLAQVAEWAGRPADALEQWRWLVERTASSRAIQGVLRLAPGLNDDEALLAVWRRVGETRPLTSAEARRLADLFERVGRPEDGIAWFTARQGKRSTPENLELIAFLADRSGRTDVAIDAYERIARTSELTSEQALALATLHIKRGAFRRGYDVLAAARARARPGDDEFWRLFGELAWQLQEDEAAGEAYTHLTDASRARSFEIVRLASLLKRERPDEAARLAEAGWLRLRETELLLVALDLYAQRADTASLDRLFASVTEAEAARLAGTAYFFVLRANRLAQQRETARALADYKRALAINPSDIGIRTALLWFLIDTKQLAELRRTMRAYAREASSHREYWAPYAAGHLALEEQRKALGYFRREVRDKKEDYLWLLNYADTLEAAGEASMAWRVRRHAWHVVRAARERDPQRFARREDMLAYARLATYRAPGDPALAAIRLVLRQDDGATKNTESSVPLAPRALEAAAKELALGWAISTENHEAAKAWLWRQYGRRLVAPGWAEVSVALAHNDLDTLDRLLASADRVPRYNRVDAARALDRRALAQTFGAEAQERYPDDDEVHLRLDTDFRATASSAIVRETWFDYSPLRGINSFGAVPIWIGERARLAPFVSWTRQTSNDPATLTGVPGSDTELGVSGLLRYPHHQTELTVSRRAALANVATARLAHTHALAARITATATLGYNLRAPDTTALLVGGVKDEARLAVSYGLAKREYVNGGAAFQKFHTQDRGFLGEGRRYDFETGYRFRTEYPDLGLRLYAARQEYRHEGFADALAARLNPAGSIPPASFFLPQSFNYYSASLGFGGALRGESFLTDRLFETPYARGWRAFADAGYAYSSILRSGYNLMFGGSGSIFGNDYLAAYFVHAEGGTGTFTTVREIGIRYQYFF
jgi:hypothetical protein